MTLTVDLLFKTMNHCVRIVTSNETISQYSLKHEYIGNKTHEIDVHILQEKYWQFCYKMISCMQFLSFVNIKCNVWLIETSSCIDAWINHIFNAMWFQHSMSQGCNQVRFTIQFQVQINKLKYKYTSIIMIKTSCQNFASFFNYIFSKHLLYWYSRPTTVIL